MGKRFVAVATGSAVIAGLVAVVGTAGAQGAPTPGAAAMQVRAACAGGDFAGRWTRPDGSVIEFAQSGKNVVGNGIGFTQNMNAKVAGNAIQGTFTVANGSGGPFTLTLSPDRGTLTYMGRFANGSPDGPYTWTFRECDPQTTSNPVGANLSRVIPAPQVVGAGPTSIVAPGIISIGTFTSSRCVLTRVSSSKPARTLVTIFSGTRSKRVFGQKLVVFRTAGAKTACIPVPAHAKTFNVRTKLGLALGYAAGATPRPKAKPTKPTIKPIKLVP